MGLPREVQQAPPLLPSPHSIVCHPPAHPWPPYWSSNWRRGAPSGAAPLGPVTLTACRGRPGQECISSPAGKGTAVKARCKLAIPYISWQLVRLPASTGAPCTRQPHTLPPTPFWRPSSDVPPKALPQDTFWHPSSEVSTNNAAGSSPTANTQKHPTTQTRAFWRPSSEACNKGLCKPQLVHPTYHQSPTSTH